MTKVVVFFGPKNEFSKLYRRKKLVKSVVQITESDDNDRRAIRHDIPGYSHEVTEVPSVNNLIANSEDYTGLTEFGMSSLLMILKKHNVKNLFLQNPPRYILELLEKAEYNIEIKNFEFNIFSENSILDFNLGYENSIIGQNTAKEELLAKMYGYVKASSNKPLVLLFFGPSGVGKTETAKFIANLTKQELFRKQFSMFHSNDFADYVFGAKHSQTSLSRDLLERKSNVILFDEFDKPNPVFFSAFYQLFDEGIFVDKNYSVDMSNSIIICTSNYSNVDEIRNKLGDPIYSRFDGVVEFKKISERDMKFVIEKEYINLLSNYSESEIESLTKTAILDKLLSSASRINNVRHLRTVLKDAFNSHLVKEFIIKNS